MVIGWYEQQIRKGVCKMKRIAAIFCFLAVLITSFTSCTYRETTINKSTDAETKTTEIKDEKGYMTNNNLFMEDLPESSIYI